MSLSLEHVDASVPITGLKELRCGLRRLLLQSQGPFCVLIDAASGDLLFKLRVFQRNNIHGFIVREQSSHDDGSCTAKILAWGGHSLRLLFFSGQKYELNGRTQGSLSNVTAEYAAPDWVLDACSAHDDDNDSFTYLVTAHNALLKADVTRKVACGYSSSIHVRQIAAGVKSILYSAGIQSLSATHILIAAGTVFGEIIVWSCFLDCNNDKTSEATTPIHHFFTGHEGSIFGVSISSEIPFLKEDNPGRLLASCSDDRTVRIWDISDCCYASPEVPSAYSTDGFELRSTGFSSTAANSLTAGSEQYVVKEWGHVSRIWDVQFLIVPSTHPTQLNLVSMGEDATCQLWTLEWNKSSPAAVAFRLVNISTLHRHAGKHIWSHALSEGTAASAVVYTGGADGGVRTFELSRIEQDHAEQTNQNSLQYSYTVRGLIKALNSRVPTERTLKAFAFVAEDCFIASSYCGAVQLGWIDDRCLDENENKPHIRWETILVNNALRGASFISSLPSDGLAIVSGGDGWIRLYNHSTRNLTDIIKVSRTPIGLFILDLKKGNVKCGATNNLGFVISYPQSDVADLVIVKTEALETHAEKVQLALSYGFMISCASFLYGGQTLALGSKTGSLAIYKVSFEKTLQQLSCTHRVHGKSAISFMSRITSPGTSAEQTTEYLLTCGRDGNYCIHVFEPIEDLNTTQELQTIHCCSSSFIRHIEGAYFDAVTQDLMLYGFRSDTFILWNETTQTKMMSFECGGAHRAWAYHPSDVSGTGIVIWNQAASLHVIVTPSTSQRSLRIGGHGREIKAMMIANVIDGFEGPLIATGAEDTTVRIFTLNKSAKDGPWGSLQCQRVLNQHSSGIQQVMWSRDGKFLFTSGGAEEFFVWRIRSVPKFGVAAIIEASSARDDERSDLRVTSFDIVDVESPSGEDCFLICLAYSNSTVKIFLYSSSQSSHIFVPLAKGTYTTNCLTQIRFLIFNHSTYLISGSTDGYLAIWCLDSVLDRMNKFTCPGSTAFDPSFNAEKIPAETISWQSHHLIHSSSIKSLEMMTISEHAILLIGGGDDNALSITVLRSDLPMPDAETPVIYTISIPDAHASAITTIKTLRCQSLLEGRKTANAIIASSGNDQRVKIWSISIDLEKEGVDAIDIVQRLDRYSPVADISSMDIVHLPSGEGSKTDMGLVVCGVGMEILKYRLD